MSAIESILLPWSRRTAWLLAVWAVFLAASTVTHQPDFRTDFGAYADYVTTTPFLLSHLVLSILGGGLGIVGAAALAVLVAGGSRGRTGLRGFGLFALGNTFATAVFGVAAFFQPAIGRAFRDGVSASPAINEDVYGAVLNGTVFIGTVAMAVGTAWLARAVAAADAGVPQWATRTMMWSLPPFVLTGIVGLPVQPLFAVALAVSIAVSLRRLGGAEPDLSASGLHAHRGGPGREPGQGVGREQHEQRQQT